MECSLRLTTSPPTTSITDTRRSRNYKSRTLQVSAVSYREFINFAIEETKSHTVLVPSPLQEKYRSVIALDGETELQMVSFQAPKIRLLRSLSIENERMQVFDFGVFPKPEFDVPIFCANFFTAASMNIIVLDLNPLHDVTMRRDYKEKYYKSLMPLAVKYAELLPWGGKLTSESLKFFSPMVIWTKFTSSQYKHDILYSAFVDYYKAWLKLIDHAVEETDVTKIMSNREAQHRYLTWRTEKDPGHNVLKKLVGEMLAKELLREFLFHGIDELESKTFLDYFPEYCCEDGNINEKRSIIGKSFENRPWDNEGEFIGGI
ncbi:phytochromobilin:ferredoxin oxidoreductase chloroplastic isoform X1 [Tripterygium wilfordii]|uniref:Phytochromobilin:ferredoxin oxidoreductase chloroplastic isoform X1 n=1 Tax=Tripterygium wilfordii TaxID=458696 RepID=A0A7J7DF95_TRIWF|nr:phytochromobilin:ferredoxin oxidoreductase, chloroplastic [Tripterygium wilfordii]KAF5745027.1 phytochromobilin:ferredoxin oxidoreductase chloroplastic isoform X1 [Tripterygium wilfordii]